MIKFWMKANRILVTLCAPSRSTVIVLSTEVETNMRQFELYALLTLLGQRGSNYVHVDGANIKCPLHVEN